MDSLSGCGHLTAGWCARCAPPTTQPVAIRVGTSYARLLAGIVRDFGVSHDVAASIVARAGKWVSECETCGQRYDADGACRCSS